MTQEKIDLIKNLMWIPMAIAVLGTYLNARKNIICFPIWIISNIALIIMNFAIEVYAMVGLFTVYTVISIYGWLNWLKTDDIKEDALKTNLNSINQSLPTGTERGKVKWYNKKKGFGFIVADIDQREIFFHQSEIDMPGFRILKENQIVCFELSQGKRGEEGRKVTPL